MMDMTGWVKDMQAAAVSPLMIHPMAASAAATALGMAAAGQMIGTMIGSMQGAMDASRRMAMPSSDSLFGGAAAWWPMPEPAASPKPLQRLKTAVAARPKKVVAEPEPKKPVAGPEPKAAAPVPVAEPVPFPDASGSISELRAAADTAAHAVLETAEKRAAPAATDAGSGVTPEDFRRPAEMAKPETPDDLKRISGIGPKLEQVLNGLGIWTLDQIVALTAQEVAWLDDYLQFKGRIERDSWQTQAKTLAEAGK